MSQKKITSELLAAVTLTLFEYNPIGINFGCNSDEYEPEAKTIITRLNYAMSADDVLVIVYEEFYDWFGDEVAGPIEKYSQISTVIHQLWLSFNDITNRS